MNPLISIVIPTYNRKAQIFQTLQSVIAQEYSRWEIIIVDDGSDDGTEQIVNLIEDDRIIFIERLDGIKGAGRCRNIGLKAAKGEYVIFLDSDDKLLSFCLKDRAAKIIEHKFDFLIFPGVVKHADKSLCYWNVPSNKSDLERFLCLDSPWQTTGAIWNRHSLLSNEVFWDEQLMIWQDIDFHIQALIKQLTYHVFWETPFDYVVNGDSIDSISRINYNSLEKINSRFAFYLKYLDSLPNFNIISPKWMRVTLGSVLKSQVLKKDWSIAVDLIKRSYLQSVITRRMSYFLFFKLAAFRASFGRFRFSIADLISSTGNTLQMIPITDLMRQNGSTGTAQQIKSRL